MGKYLEKLKNSKLLSRWAVIIELLLLQLFALPMLWLSPRFTVFWKIVITIITTVATVWALKLTADTAKLLMSQINELRQVTAVS